MTGLDTMYIREFVKAALTEDVGSGDITTLLTVPPDQEVKAHFVAEQHGIVAGMIMLTQVFIGDHLANWDSDLETSFEPICRDGYRVEPGTIISVVEGSARVILSGERVALNILQRMSGIATLTAEYVALVSHTKAKIVDTRKTTPGLRRLEKYAVTVGGGHNHRFGLSDGILIKDNHIVAAGGITAAVAAAKTCAPHTLKIEVEVTTLDELREALDAGAEIIMLDNMAVEQMREAVGIVDGKVLLEASGGVSRESVVAIAETGVDIISVGALTHSAPALDISLQFAWISPAFHYFDAVSSTNDRAIEMARQGEAEGTIVIARRQLSGRGRRGRVWQDEPGESILMSTILRPNIELAALSGLSFVVSLGVAEWLTKDMSIDAKLKWPNDVLVGGKKISGILVELTQTANGHAAVAGTGVNINQMAFAPELSEIATSAAILTGGTYEISELAETLASHILRVYEDFLEGFEEILARWRNYMWGVLDPVEITTENGTLAGVIQGVGGDGELILTDANDAIFAVHAADTIKTTRN